jgi:HSP20 family protein
MTQHTNKGLGTTVVPFSRDEFLTPFDAMFDNVIQRAFPSFSQDIGLEFFEKNSYPKVDAIDHDDKITIEAEIPGLGKDEVSVDLEKDILTISGSRNGHTPDGKLNTQADSVNPSARYIRKELKRSSFKRSFKLGTNVDPQKINADFNNGILLITILKKEPAKPKKIKIL